MFTHVNATVPLRVGVLFRELCRQERKKQGEKLSEFFEQVATGRIRVSDFMAICQSMFDGPTRVQLEPRTNVSGKVPTELYNKFMLSVQDLLDGTHFSRYPVFSSNCAWTRVAIFKSLQNSPEFISTASNLEGEATPADRAESFLSTMDIVYSSC